MKPTSTETDLHSRFQELRDEVSSSAPLFTVPPLPTTRVLPVRWRLVTAGATAVLALLLWTTVFRDGQPPVSVIDLNVVAWTAPSDYLLQTPGRDLLRSLPVFNVNVVVPIPVDPAGGIADTSS